METRTIALLLFFTGTILLFLVCPLLYMTADKETVEIVCVNDCGNIINDSKCKQTTLIFTENTVLNKIYQFLFTMSVAFGLIFILFPIVYFCNIVFNP